MLLQKLQSLHNSLLEHEIDDNLDYIKYMSSYAFIGNSINELISLYDQFIHSQQDCAETDKACPNQNVKAEHDKVIRHFVLCLQEFDKITAELPKKTADSTKIMYPFIFNRTQLVLKEQMNSLLPIKENPLISRHYNHLGSAIEICDDSNEPAPQNNPPAHNDRNKSQKGQVALVIGAVSVGSGLMGAGTAGLLSGTLITTIGVAMGTGMGIGLAGGPLGVIAGAVIGAVAGLLLAGGIAACLSHCFFNHRKSNQNEPHTDQHEGAQEVRRPPSSRRAGC
jgi:hypothetical protein